MWTYLTSCRRPNVSYMEVRVPVLRRQHGVGGSEIGGTTRTLIPWMRWVKVKPELKEVKVPLTEPVTIAAFGDTEPRPVVSLKAEVRAERRVEVKADGRAVKRVVVKVGGKVVSRAEVKVRD